MRTTVYGPAADGFFIDRIQTGHYRIHGTAKTCEAECISLHSRYEVRHPDLPVDYRLTLKSAKKALASARRKMKK